MSIFGSGNKNKVGVDIGTAAVKIVEVTKSDNRMALTNYGLFEIEPGESAISLSATDHGSGKHLSDQEVIWGVKEVVKRTGIKAKDVIASIPSFPTFSTTITLPYSSEEEIAKSVPFEARKYIPIPLSEVKLKWAVINVNKNPQADQARPLGSVSGPSVDVFFVAVPNDEIKRYEMIMKESGLNLIDLELENFALIRSLLGNDLSPVVIVNMGGRGSSIAVVDNGYQRINRDFEIGSFAITKAIAKSLNVSSQRAEELKKSLGMRSGDDNIIRQAINSLVDLIIFEASKIIFNYEDTKKTRISKVLLVGGLANMPFFTNYFAEKLGREVVIGNSLARVVLPSQLESLRPELSTTFAVAIGLAMKDVK